MTAEEFRNRAIPMSRKLYPMLFRILKNDEETRDALQDLMLKLWSKRKELDKCNNLEAYIVTMAKNHGLDLLKKKRPSTMGEMQEHMVAGIEAGHADPDMNEKYRLVHQIIEKLPEKMQTVIRLRDIDGFSFEEIKAITGLEPPHLRVILSRARQKVKQELEKIYDYDNTRRITQKIL